MSQIADCTTYSMEMIANVLQTKVTFQEEKTAENKRKRAEQYSLLKLVFSNFAPLNEKLKSARSFYNIAIKEKNLEALKRGVQLAAELEGDVQTVMDKINDCIQRCTPMVQNIEKNPHPLENIAQKNGRPFHLKNKEDAQSALNELKLGKESLESNFLSTIETKQPSSMQVPELTRAYSEQIRKFNSAQNQSALFH